MIRGDVLLCQAPEGGPALDVRRERESVRDLSNGYRVNALRGTRRRALRGDPHQPPQSLIRQV
ncbi:MAG: hypothetical protein H6935_04930 [Thiobacillus sp.]|nr:hypothetical protein [Thiobacillus sp.]